MAELQEIFESVTSRIEPDRDAWRRLEDQQRRRGTGRRVAAFAVAAAVLALTVAAIALTRTPPAEEPGGSHPRPVGSGTLVAFEVGTGDEARVMDGVLADGISVSPDGTHIAFVATANGSPNVFVARVDGTAAQQVTGLRGQPGCGCGAVEPAWSPDGEHLAFSAPDATGDRDLFVLDLRSGEMTLVTDESGSSWATTPAWSPDGTELVNAQGSPDGDPAGSGAIVVTSIRTDGAHGQTLAAMPGATDPSWSPQGPDIVFTAGGTLFRTSLAASGRPSPLLLDDSEQAAPAFSPDGAQLAFVRDGQITVLVLATGAHRTLGPGLAPAWSPDGSTIYAVRASSGAA